MYSFDADILQVLNGQTQHFLCLLCTYLKEGVHLECGHALIDFSVLLVDSCPMAALDCVMIHCINEVDSLVFSSDLHVNTVHNIPNH